MLATVAPKQSMYGTDSPKQLPLFNSSTVRSVALVDPDIDDDGFWTFKDNQKRRRKIRRMERQEFRRVTSNLRRCPREAYED